MGNQVVDYVSGVVTGLFGPGNQDVPVDLAESGEKIVGAAGQLVSAVLQTGGLYAQSEVLEKFSHVFQSAGALLYIFAFLGAMVSWTLYGNYRESIYFLLGPALFWWILGARVPASEVQWQFGDRVMTSEKGNLLRLLNWEGADDSYANKEPQISWFFSLYDGAVSNVVQNIVTVLVDTKNREDVIIAARERMLSRMLYAQGMDRPFLELVSIGMAGQCAHEANLHHQLAQADSRARLNWHVYQEQLDKLRAEGRRVSISNELQLYLAEVRKYHDRNQQSAKSQPAVNNYESNPVFIATEADRLLRQIRVDEVPADSLTCEELWKYTALAAFMLAESELNKTSSSEDQRNVPWAEVKRQVAAALVYDACGGSKTYAVREQEAKQRAEEYNQHPKASVKLWMPKTGGGPGSFLVPNGDKIPKNYVEVVREVTITQFPNAGDGQYTIVAPNGDVLKGQFDIPESMIKYDDGAVNTKLGKAVESVSGRRECQKGGTPEVTSKATEVVAAMIIRNTLGSSVFQKVTGNLQDRGSWDPAIYRTVFGNIPQLEKEARRTTLMYFAGAIPYLQGVLLFLLSMLFPFFALFIIMPGKLPSFGVWLSAWLWVKSWDVGFASLFFFREMLWQYMQGDIRYNANIESMRWDSPDLVYSVMFQTDPVANLHTYFHVIALFTLSIPLFTAHLCLGASDIVEALRESIDLKATQAGQRKGRATRRMEASIIGRYITERKGAYEKAFDQWARNNPGRNIMGERRDLKSDAQRIRFAAISQRIAMARFYSNENQFLHRNMLAAVTGRKMSYTHGLMGTVADAYMGLRQEQFSGPTTGRDLSLLPMGIMDTRFNNDTFGTTIGTGGMPKGEDVFGADRYDTDGQ